MTSGIDMQTATHTNHGSVSRFPANLIDRDMGREQGNMDRGVTLPCACLVVQAERLATAGHDPWRRTGTTPPAAAHLTCWSSPAPPCTIKMY